MNTQVIAQASNSNITKVKAYSSVHDEVSNIAKHAARYPNQNFADVSRTELSKTQYDVLLLQAGSVDITNLSTIKNPTEHFEYFNQQAVQSANNLFNVAVQAISTQPSLQKVVIFKQTPRYDTIQDDPLQLKQALSQIFNNSLVDLWIKSPLKDKIFIGTHNIECTGGIREARYRCTKTGRYDGVHLYGTTGSKAYTNSVWNILKSAGIISQEGSPCTQFECQKRRAGNNTNQRGATHCNSHELTRDIGQNNKRFSVPTQNRFNTFSGNY